MKDRTPKSANIATPPKQEPTEAKNNTQRILLPAEAAEQRRLVKDVYLSLIGANVLAVQMKPFVGGRLEKTDHASAQIFIAALKESVRPRDAVEEMLLMQMAWTHARLASLSAVAGEQTITGNVRVLNDACDRAAATFRKQMLALAEYRRPPRNDSFVAIRQANVAQQQVVANGQELNRTKPIAANEVASSAAPSLPFDAQGMGGVEPVGAAQSAVDAQHRPANESRQGTILPQRHQAR